MNVDKDTLNKNKFWILLGLSLPMLLLALLFLWTSVAGAINTERDAITKAEKSVKDITSPKNEKHIEQIQKKDDKVSSKKNDVHERAWRRQAVLMTWPEPLREKMKNAYFGDPIHHEDRGNFADRWYNSQIRSELYLHVDPYIPAKGEGVMQFKGGPTGWEMVVQPIRQWRPSPPPTDEDIWLAQEDIWVKRELMRVAKDANDYVATYRGPKPPEKPLDKSKLGKGEEVVDHKLFTNEYLQVEFYLVKNARGNHFLRGVITNISKRRYPLNMYLDVRLQKGGVKVRPARLPISGDMLPAGDTAPIKFVDKDNKELPVDTYNPRGLYSVTQVFDWRTAPVKRIDLIVMGYPAHRFANRSLKPYPAFAPKVEEGADATTSAPPTEPGMGRGEDTGSADGGMPGGFGGMMGGMRGMGGMGGMAATNMTENGLRKDRYMDVTAGGPVRRMPVALTVVVDQAHIPEVLTAFANSRLRIQTTQAHWQRCYDTLRPPDPQEFAALATTGTAGNMPGRSMPFGPMGGRGEDAGSSDSGMSMPGSGMMGMGMPGMMMPGMGTPGSMFSMMPEMDEAEQNLVELSVYGIASLYERYPPRKPPEQAGEAPATGEAGTTPPAAGQATTGTKP